MAGQGGEDHFPLWFRPSSLVETTPSPQAIFQTPTRPTQQPSQNHFLDVPSLELSLGQLNLSAPTRPSDQFLEGLEDLSLRPLFENNVIQNGSRRNSFAYLNRPPAAAAPFLSFSGINTSSDFLSLQCLWSQRTDGRSVNRDLGSQSSGSRSVNGEWESWFLEIVNDPLEKLRGRVFRMSRDPQVRCSLEEKFVERDQAYIELIFSEVMKNDVFELIVDRNTVGNMKFF